MTAVVCILSCADGGYHVGSARGASDDPRLSEHQAGTFPGYTSRQRSVVLIHAEAFERIVDAIAAEQRIKGWSRDKKEALIRSDWEALRHLARRSAVQRKSDQTPSS